MDEQLHPTLYCACDYLSMLGSKLNRVSKRWLGICSTVHILTFSQAIFRYKLGNKQWMPQITHMYGVRWDYWAQWVNVFVVFIFISYKITSYARSKWRQISWEIIGYKLKFYDSMQTSVHILIECNRTPVTPKPLCLCWNVLDWSITVM